MNALQRRQAEVAEQRQQKRLVDVGHLNERLAAMAEVAPQGFKEFQEMTGLFGDLAYFRVTESGRSIKLGVDDGTFARDKDGKYILGAQPVERLVNP